MIRTPRKNRIGRQHAKRLPGTPALTAAAPLLALTALAFSGAPAQASPNLVLNGTFASPTLAPSSNACSPTCTSFEINAFSNAGTSYTGTMPDWTSAANTYTFVFTSGSATAVGNAGTIALGDGATIGNSPIGGNFIVSDPVYDAGSISQTISGLKANAPATVTFYWGVAQQTTFTGSVTGDWQVSLCPTSGCVGSDTQSTTSVSIPQQGFSGWLTSTMTFIPTSTSEVLTFLAVGSGAPVFLLLDGVSASQVPEPASWAITLAGLVGLGVMSRRRLRSAPPPAAA